MVLQHFSHRWAFLHSVLLYYCTVCSREVDKVLTAFSWYYLYCTISSFMSFRTVVRHIFSNCGPYSYCSIYLVSEHFLIASCSIFRLPIYSFPTVCGILAKYPYNPTRTLACGIDRCREVDQIHTACWLYDWCSIGRFKSFRTVLRKSFKTQLSDSYCTFFLVCEHVTSYLALYFNYIFHPHGVQQIRLIIYL